MKQAKLYEKKIRKLLVGAGKVRAIEHDKNPIEEIIPSVLAADTPARQVERAISAITNEYIDFNELRVSPTKDISECLGKDYPQAREKAEMLTRVLNGIFDRANDASLEYLKGKTKRDIRRHFLELGMHRYGAASMMLMAFDGHAMPVDQTLVECLEMEGYIHPGSDLEDVQSFLERVITHKFAIGAHEFFRNYVEKLAGALKKKRQADAKAQAKADAEKAAAKKAAAKKAAKATARKKAAEKKAAKKAKPVKKPATSAAKKTIKAAKKTTKPAAKKAAKATSKKRIAKKARKAGKKAAKK